jgi:hypothetical protein
LVKPFLKGVFSRIHQQNHIMPRVQPGTNAPVRLAPEPPRPVSGDSVPEFPGKRKPNPVQRQIILHNKELRPGTSRASSLLENIPDIVPFLEPLFPSEPKRNLRSGGKRVHLIRLLFVGNRQFKPTLCPPAF